jgi:tetratricopeptide (TPR) repeat protein
MLRGALGALQVVALAAFASACKTDTTACEVQFGARNWAAASAACMESFRRSGDPAPGMAAAEALLELGQLREAESLARELTGSAHAAASFSLLAKAAQRRGADDEALDAYGQALVEHQADGNLAAASRVAHVLAGALWARGEVARAVEKSQLAVTLADQASDPVMATYGRMGFADLLRQRGLMTSAEAELQRAGDLATSPQAEAWVALKRGILYVDLGLPALAQQALRRALTPVRGVAPTKEIQLAAHLNLAWLARRAGELPAAIAHLDAAELLASDDVDVLLNRALLLADQGALDDALGMLARAAQRSEGDSAAWWVAYHQGLLYRRKGDLAAEAAAYQRAIAAVQALASLAGPYARELAASHRLPYLRMLGLHARHGDWKQALGLVIELDQLALLAAETVRDSAAVTPAFWSALSRASSGVSVSIDEVLHAWRGRQLSIAITDEEAVWRLEVRDGAVSGVAVGGAATLERLAAELEADPDDRAAARALGMALIPRDWTSEPVYVLTVGLLSRAPLGALWLPGVRTRATAPLLRVLGVRPHPPVRRARVGHLVLGDPRSDLPSARLEATLVSAQLGGHPLVGGDATAQALASARGAELLHIAAHSSIDERGAALLLADHAVTANEIAAMGSAPRVVVLASCGSAVARDEAGWGSLAAAFLTAGAETVLASSWTVDDASTVRFIDELYRHPVMADPARALAAAQAATRTTLPARTWAAFTVIAAPPALQR